MWITEYRKKLLGGDVGLGPRKHVRDICSELEAEIIEGHDSEDHVHLFVSCSPHVSPSYLMQRVKGKTSRKLLQQFRHLKKACWGRHLWARGGLVVGSGNVTDEVIMGYIRTQDVTKADFHVAGRHSHITGLPSPVASTIGNGSGIGRGSGGALSQGPSADDSKGNADEELENDETPSGEGVSSLLGGAGHEPAFDASDGGGGNCTRDPDSVTTIRENRLRLLTEPTTAPQERGLGTDVHQMTLVDARLARLCEAWPSLQEHVILAILALVDSSPRVV